MSPLFTTAFLLPVTFAASFIPGPFGKEYAFNSEARIWSASQQYCLDRGASLVKVESELEQNWILNNVVSGKFWLAGVSFTSENYE